LSHPGAFIKVTAKLIEGKQMKIKRLSETRDKRKEKKKDLNYL